MRGLYGRLTGDAPLTVDPATGAAYGEALYRVFTAVARFRARLTGPQTPIKVRIVWMAQPTASWSRHSAPFASHAAVAP